MTEKIPIITVTCLRDLPLLELQAQSIKQYLAKDCPVYIVVNEENPEQWFKFFDQHIRHYYNNHKLNIITRESFNGDWNQWIPSNVNPWAVGWETQQILKLAISKKLTSIGYLVLDSQNFLIRHYDPNGYSLSNGKIPYRLGYNSMPAEIWEQYSTTLGVNILIPDKSTNVLSICTPIYMHTGLVNELLDKQGDIAAFSRWFKSASRIKSEFILYVVWAEKQGGISKLHQAVDDWGNPMLRDCDNFDAEFENFINAIGIHAPLAWISVNHRSWGDMSNDQYSRLCRKLNEYSLIPKFIDYRSTYIDYKF